MTDARAFRGFRFPGRGRPVGGAPAPPVPSRSAAATSSCGTGQPLGFRLGIQPMVPGGFLRRPTRNRHPIAPVPESAHNRPARHAEKRRS
jgi:hypothetical protein